MLHIGDNPIKTLKNKNCKLVQTYVCRHSKMTKEEKYLYDNRVAINNASRVIDAINLPISLKNDKVDADIIGAIILDELQRKGFDDSVQDLSAKFIHFYEGVFENVERWLLSNIFKDIEDMSLGSAQIKPNVVYDLVTNGFIEKPSNWEEDKLDITINWLLDPHKSAELVGARIEQTIVHWAKGKVDISNRPEILGTLYSLGLTGRSGVHDKPNSNSRGDNIGNDLREKAKKILSCP